MTSVASMPGNWPESRDEHVSPGDLRIYTCLGQRPLQVPTMASITSSSRDSRDELFFDCKQIPTAPESSEESFSSYLVFEPVVESVANDEPIDWRRYEHPQELLNFQDGTSVEIQELLPSSIDRVKARHEEEERQRIAAARRDRPIGRVGRASVKPRRERENVTSSHPLEAPSRGEGSSRLSGVSATSIASNDSGYTSMLIEPDPNPEQVMQSNSVPRKPFALSSIFRRKFHFESLEKSNVPAPSERLQIPAPTRPSLTVESITAECVSCLDDFSLQNVIKLSCHSYCIDCFQGLIRTALESETHWPAKCCLNPIPPEQILPNIDESTKQKYKQRDAEWSIPTSDRIYCTHAGCSSWIPPKNTNAQRNSARCPKCSKRTCTLCRGSAHSGNECPQDPAMSATVNLAEMEGWRRCYSCHAFVEHNRGCRHMTCRCKAQFCYICGERWKTCACTEAQLITLQLARETRRQEAIARTTRDEAAARRQEAEEEEIRMALQQVAEFERAEAGRVAAEAEVQRLREEEERRIREEERRRREEERIAEVNRRFRQMNLELEILNDVQRVLMAERYEFESEVMKKELQDTLDTFAIRHPSELGTLESESRSRISDSEQRFEQEYQVRLTEERHIEDDYVSQLREFYKGRPEAEYRVRDARDELRQSQDKEYRFWDAYRRQQLQAVREGECRKMEMLRVKHASEIKAAEGRARIDEVEWKRKVSAESQWADVVAAERIAILGEMEQQEYARV